VAPLKGFQELGEPESWDMAVGSVRGYRWWNLYMYFTSRGSAYDRYTGVSLRDSSWDYSQWVPNFSRSNVQGMHGGSWDLRTLHPADPWHKAKCARNVSAWVGRDPLRPPTHDAPDPECGCGFWAYWDSLNPGEFCCMPYIRHEPDYGYTVQVPLGGVIEGAGRTIIGERGFRSERAKITNLYMEDSMPTMFEEQPPDYLKEQYLDSANLGSAVALSYNISGGPMPTCMTTAALLSQRMQVPEEEITRTFRDAVSSALGYGFTWHWSLDGLMRETVPDERYAPYGRKSS